jgi:hypothetical protein
MPLPSCYSNYTDIPLSPYEPFDMAKKSPLMASTFDRRRLAVPVVRL